MAGTGTKRITELTEASTIQNGDFIAVDSNARGTKKVPTSALATSAALTAETNARAGADEQMSERMDGIEEQTALIQNPTKTLSGALVSFTDGADMPMVACTAEIVPKQAGSGTPSPDNVRQISGWESVQTSVAGGNLIDVSTNQSGAIDASGNEVANSTFNRTDFIPIDKAMVYVKTSAASGYTIRVHGYSSSKTWVQQLKLISTSGTTLLVDVTAPNNIAYVRLSYPVLGVDNTELWQGQTITKDLGRTVYGGTLDVVSGALTVTHGYLNYNGSENWQADSGRYTIGVSGSYREGYTRIPVTSNEGVFGTGSSVGTIFLSNTQLYYYPPTSVTSLADFKTWLASNNLQVVYPLATPQTYTLTGQEVSTLLGDNNVWADSGDVEITYRRDISIVINNLESALNG